MQTDPSQNSTRFEASDYSTLSAREWLLTNGIGGYASSTLCGTNTRRYHGLLVASFNPPTQRLMMVSRVEETMVTGDNWIPLSTSAFTGAVHPEGYRQISWFERQPLPCTCFRSGEAELKKTVFMLQGSNTTVIEYENTSDVPFGLKLEPLYGVRDYHGLLHETHDYKFFIRRQGHTHSLYAYAGAHPVLTGYSMGEFTEERRWVKNFEYAVEKERGQDHHEDLFSAGFITCDLSPGRKLHLVFTIEEQVLKINPEALKSEELSRLQAIVPKETGNRFLADLILCGEQFLVKRRSTSNHTIIAGYHWFTDWGRDAMIALRGLCIATGKQEEARSVILTFLQFLNEGIIPNRFPDYENEQLEYHTIDATLWLFVAVYEYDRRFNDTTFIHEVLPKLEEIIRHHIKGTLHNIHVTVRGFLYGASDNLPLTWMDARMGNKVFTPRQGCPVEITALWYNALKIYEHASGRAGKTADPGIMKVAQAIEKYFRAFYMNKDGYLNDVVGKNREPDDSIRPNQVFALSLPFRLLNDAEEKAVLENVRHHLLTPYGLRTLSPGHQSFRPVYEGDFHSRDSAYHQGTVWPWLLPEYLCAWLRLNGRSPEARAEAEELLQPLKQHFYRNDCVLGISEIFDGLDPEEGKGCAHQAWSVSQLIWLIVNENLEP